MLETTTHRHYPIDEESQGVHPYLDDASFFSPSVPSAIFGEWNTCLSCCQPVCVCVRGTDANDNTQLESDRQDQWIDDGEFSNDKSEEPDLSDKLMLRSRPAKYSCIRPTAAGPKSSKRKRSTSTDPRPTPKSKRTRISDASKSILNVHFRIDPYPSDEAVALLCRMTMLDARAIKNWFANTRSRRTVSRKWTIFSDCTAWVV